MSEYIFRVVRFDEHKFGFFPQYDEETYDLYEKMCEFFSGMGDKIKLVTGLMANINTVDYDGMLFWSGNISNYVHETEDSPETFKFVYENNEFIISPYARIDE